MKVAPGGLPPSHEPQRPLRKGEHDQRDHRSHPEQHFLCAAVPRHGALAVRSTRRGGLLSARIETRAVDGVEAHREQPQGQNGEERAKRLEPARETSADTQGDEDEGADTAERCEEGGDNGTGRDEETAPVGWARGV